MSAAASFEVLRAAERTAVPWKNGGGITREVVVSPPGSGLQGFDWRVSIAEIRTAGPFSAFPGIERRMAVVSGRLSLAIDGASPVTLDPLSEAITFPGEVPVFAAPLGAPVTDLNVMTRRSRCSAALTRGSTREAAVLEPSAGAVILVALDDLVVRGDREEVSLAPLDALRLGRGARCAITARSGPAAFHLIEIC